MCIGVEGFTTSIGGSSPSGLHSLIRGAEQSPYCPRIVRGFKKAQRIGSWRRERPGVVDAHCDAVRGTQASNQVHLQLYSSTPPLLPITPSPGPSVPAAPSPWPACLASASDSQGGGHVFGKTSHWGQEFRKEGGSGCKMLIGLSSPDCDTEPRQQPRSHEEP